MYKHYFFLMLLATSLAATACKKNYDTVKAKELATGVRYDSIFFGYHFGMARQDFFAHSLELNQQGLVTNGPENQTILYRFEEGFKSPISMNFYPDFADDKIYRMRIYFSYDSWSPWNRDYFADKCLPDVLKILESRYFAGDFFNHKLDKRVNTKVQVKGNREVRVSVKDERTVFATVTDLTVVPPVDNRKNQTPDAPRPLWERTDQNH
jgi:hypothetical protein